jgi:hypothetical protein
VALSQRIVCTLTHILIRHTRVLIGGVVFFGQAEERARRRKFQKDVCCWGYTFRANDTSASAIDQWAHEDKRLRQRRVISAAPSTISPEILDVSQFATWDGWKKTKGTWYLLLEASEEARRKLAEMRFDMFVYSVLSYLLSCETATSAFLGIISATGKSQGISFFPSRSIAFRVFVH